MKKISFIKPRKGILFVQNQSLLLRVNYSTKESLMSMNKNLYEMTKKSGMLSMEITEMLKKAEVEYAISDDRESGEEVDVVFKSELYEEQKAALRELLKSDCGVLSAGTRFGKTVTAMGISILFLCNAAKFFIQLQQNR